ncbi:hypothetical protein MSLAZ_0758 [Methanosarcina lacustris Z-7289]|uniref:DUF1638 domain-containing protein n=1 Tax=Methanosarcina lacustris Z-7289 TaxID=1434111 RepID=A0A0E3S081_9EURY|nr:DUF1638 domain-containing protein [Methanosarcina lacustris]AKB74019.1 hypothetical protein MSLAZ_0758 [Methanosarcina lacustris Z-7289]
MPVLSIIACEMLEDELVYVLSKDQNPVRLITFENRQCFRFVRKLKSRNCQVRLFPSDRISFFVKQMNCPVSLKIPNFLLKFPLFGKIHENLKGKNRAKGKNIETITVVINILKLGLHADCDHLKFEIYRNMKEMADFSDGILIYYGNCGRPLRALEAEFKDFNCPLYFLEDEKGDIVDDCISVALGGNDAYAEVTQSGNGTGIIYLTPMWASSWKDMKKESLGTSDVDESFLKNPLYKKVVKIGNEISRGDEFDKNVLNFARTFDMSVVEREGSMEIARRAYLNARNNICKKFPD